MRRKVTPEEIRLWKLQMRDVKPLPETPPLPEVPQEPPKSVAPKTPETPSVKPTPRDRVELSPAHSFDRPEYRQVKIEARLDLHGMNFEEAQRALHKFFLRAQEKGIKTILVITGKGPIHEERTIRHYLPRWLEDTPLKPLVESFHYPAKPQHGGHGAYYVKIRRFMKK